MLERYSRGCRVNRAFERWPRYLACPTCKGNCPHRVYWAGQRLAALCPLCGSSRRVPKRAPYFEMAQRADHDILLAFYERKQTGVRYE